MLDGGDVHYNNVKYYASSITAKRSSTDSDVLDEISPEQLISSHRAHSFSYYHSRSSSSTASEAKRYALKIPAKYTAIKGHVNKRPEIFQNPPLGHSLCTSYSSHLKEIIG